MRDDRLVFRIDVPINGSGDLSTYWATTHGWRTSASDTPASTYMPARVRRAGSFARSLFAGGAMGGLIRPNYGTLTLANDDGGLDAFAQYAGGGGTVTCYWGQQSAAFPTGYTVVYTASIASVVVDWDSVVIRQQDQFERLDRPIVTAMFAGTGGLEGSSGANRPKQLVFGTPGLVPLIPINTTYQVYYVQANATDLPTVSGLTEFGVVFEGGVPIARAEPYTRWQELFDAASAPDPGEFRLWTGYGINRATGGNAADARVYTRGPIFVRLGGVPVGELRFGPVGRLQNTASQAPREWRFSDLCNRAGLDVSTSTMATMQGQVMDFTAGNRLVDGTQTYAAVMSDRCQALLGACGFNRTGAFFCVQIRSPDAGSDTVQATFTAANCADIRRQPVPGMERPVWQVTVRAGTAYPCATFEGASAEMADILSRQGHLTAFRGWSRGVRRRYASALSVDLAIAGHDFPTVDEQRAFVDAFGALYGTQRDLMSVRCLDWSAAMLQLELHDKVTLAVPRLGYDAGVSMRIVSIETDLDNRSIRLGLWGNSTGTHSWRLEGGMFPADAGEPGGSWGGDEPPDDVVQDDLQAAGGISGPMGDFTGRLIGGPVAVAVAAGVAALMGDFTGALRGGIAGGGTTTMTWASGDKHASITLSNGNLTATGTATSQLVRGTVSKATGKWYFEVTVATAVTFGTVGVAKSTTSTGTWVGGDTAPGSYGLGPAHSYQNGGSDSTTNAINSGDVVGVAVDLDAGLIWWHINGVWINDAGGTAGDPAAGTHERYSGLTGTYYPASAPGAADHTINATFSYPIPSGFTAWE